MTEKLKVLDLFSGIGGFSLGLERTGGFETVAFCEIEEYPRRVLARHWPEVPRYEDVTKLTGDILGRDGIAVDVITGGFPCQDISVAGRRAGLGEGTRSGLWSEIVRLIGELQPRYVILENVANLLTGPGDKRGGWFGRILGDLAECGYDAEWENIPAAAMGAPHRRERIWIVAHPTKGVSESPNRKGAGSAPAHDARCPIIRGGGTSDVADTAEVRQSGPRKSIFAICAEAQEDRQAVGTVSGGVGSVWRSESDVGRGFDGLSEVMDGGLGDEAKARASKILRDMWFGDDPQEIWQSTGGFDGVSEAEIMFAFLCEYEARKNSGRLAVEREAARKECLRGVWRHIEAARSPLQSRHNGQYASEFANALRELSRNSPSLYPQAWQSGFWEDETPRVANGVPKRVDRLGCLGNAIVPQIATLIGSAILDSINTQIPDQKFKDWNIT